MKVLDIREARVPLRSSIRNAVVAFDSHDVSLVAVITDVEQQGRPLVGLAFNSIGRFAQQGILRERVIPRLLAEAHGLLDAAGEAFVPADVFRSAMRNEKPGGHGDRAAAVAAVELAFWDLNAKLRDEPAHATISRAFNATPINGDVPVYAAGGYYQGEGADARAALQTELRSYLEQGYGAVKIKVAGAPLAEDLRRIDAALEVLGDGSRLAVDANGRLSRDEALTYAEALAPRRLRWFEEPGDPLDFELLAALTATDCGPIATGENLFSNADVVNLLRYGGLRPGADVLQMDAGLSYGLTEYVRMLETLQVHGFDRTSATPHGGHLINLHIVKGLGCGGCEAYPGVFAPVGGFTDACRIENGQIKVPDEPGFGLESKRELRPLIARLVPELGLA